MKKAKRFLTGLLSAALALSLCAMPAMAADNGETITSTINTAQKGSLTINKYEGDAAVEDKLLNGVTFTAYKVADIVQPTEAGTTDVKMQPVAALTKIKSDIQITSETKYGDIKKTVEKALAEDANPKLTAFATAKTGDNGTKGQAVFSGMPVGVYLIVETDAPSQIVNKTANFLVSIPMVKEDRTGWNYDIVANPKNAAVYGGISLIKYGKNYNPDGTFTEVALSGATFYLQHQEGDKWVTVTAHTVSGGNGSVDSTSGLLTTSDSGMINITDLAPGTYRFIEHSAPQGYIMDGQAAYVFTINNDKTVTISEAYKDAIENTIKVVNEKPNIEKQVKTGVNTENNEDVYGKATDASVDDVVTWKVTAAVPSNVDKLAKYSLTDNMSNALTWESEAEAKLTIETNQNVDLEKGTDYTLTVPEDGEEGGTWTIEFTPSGKEKLATSNVTSISVTFNTKLNSNATVNNKGNLNDAGLTYSNGFKSDNEEYPDQPDPKDEVIKNEASVYTFGMNVEKVDGKDSSVKLPDAEFDLYLYKGSEENPTEADLKNSDKAVKIGHYKTDKDGKINVSGLKNGTYYLVETKAPIYRVEENGKTYSYNLLKEPVKVDVAVEYEVTTTTTTDPNGNVTTNKIESKKYVGGEDNSGNYKVIIKNNKGFDLPTTGGFGTLLFSGIGVLLVVAGVGVLLSLKKKNRA
mgnify:CR=1 FL=1